MQARERAEHAEKRSTVGGYQGPVLVLTLDGTEVAHAACRYRAEVDWRGEDHWQGQLHRVSPPDAVAAGTYRLRFPDGEQGEVTIPAVTPESDVVRFIGIGARPVFPLRPADTPAPSRTPAPSGHEQV